MGKVTGLFKQCNDDEREVGDSENGRRYIRGEDYGIIWRRQGGVRKWGRERVVDNVRGQDEVEGGCIGKRHRSKLKPLSS